MNKILLAAWVVLLVGIQHTGYAQYRIKKPLFGDSNQVVLNAIAEVSDTVNPARQLPTNQLNPDAFTVISSVFFDEQDTLKGKLYPDSMQVRLKVTMLYTRASDGKVDSIKNQPLLITYYKNKPYKARDIIQMFNVKASRLRIDSIFYDFAIAPATVARRFLRVQNELVVDRDYKFSCTDNAVKTITGLNNTAVNGEYEVSWPVETSADEYDVEWHYVEKSALDAGLYNMSTTNTAIDVQKVFKDAARVSIKGSKYSIPMLYDDLGTLFFRVRAVQYLNNQFTYISNWSSDYSGGLGRFNYTGHQNNLNWQATTSYAEDGKRKSVIQYFDGTLRGRQTVTKDNSRDATVVAETYYNKQGAPAIQILPAPTLNRIIKYTPLINQVSINNGGAELIKSIYDTVINPADFCATGMPKMHNTTGAAQYYSPNNPNAAKGMHQAIPDADGYVFSETKYEQDNTGRVLEQGGVGAAYQIGSGKTTKYFYGGTSPEELDAIFGTEAGDASYYRKNIVQDPNGQVSVSYADMHGRTVATSLAGDPPTTLNALSNFSVDAVTTRSFIKGNNNIINGNAIELTDALVVEKAGTHKFTYSLTPEVLTLQNCNNSNICYDCMYDLNITISSSCYEPAWNGTTLTIKKNNISLADLDVNCNVAIKPKIEVNTDVFLNVGSYTVTKSLTISEAAIRNYTDNVFLPNNVCKTFEQIKNEQVDIVTSMINCKAPEIQTPKYAAYKETMLNQLNPSGGIYARYPIDENTPDKFNIFGAYATPSNKFPNRILNYQYPLTPYLNTDNSPSLIYSRELQKEVSPEDLSPEEFAANFKLSWSNSLLPMHPEYCLLQKHESLEAAYIYGETMEGVKTYKKAKEDGFLDPLKFGANSIGHTYGRLICNLSLNYVPDLPIFRKSRIDQYYFKSDKTDFCDINKLLIQAAPNSTNTGFITLWNLATATATCQNQPNASGGTPTPNTTCINTYSNINKAFDESTLCEADLDMAWVIFRNMYLSKRAQHINNEIINSCTVNENLIVNNARVFPNISAFTNANNNATTSQQNANDGLTDFYDKNCKAHADTWFKNLAPCALAGETRLTTADSTWIISRLVEVCKQGSDVTHPLGSSTVKPGSTYQYKSFEEVVKAFAELNGRDQQRCNAFLITGPPVYEVSAPSVSKTVITKLETCECERLSAHKVAYEQSYPKVFANFSDYLKKQHNANISEADLAALTTSCNDASCRYLGKPIQLPLALQCNTSPSCVNCETLGKMYDSYVTKFPSKLPVKKGDYYLDDAFNNILFANFMNQQLGFNHKPSEYLYFIDNCGGIRTTANNTGGTSNTTIPCTDVLKYVKDFAAIYKDKLDDRVYKDIKITPVTEKLVQTINALLKAYNTYPNPVMDYPFALGAFNNEVIAPAFSNKLNSITRVPFSYVLTSTADGIIATPKFEDNYIGGWNGVGYTAVMPMDMNYVFTAPSSKPVQDAFANITALDADFAGPIPANEKDKKVFAGALILRGTLKLYLRGVTGCEIPYKIPVANIISDPAYKKIVPYFNLLTVTPLQRYILPQPLYEAHAPKYNITYNIYTVPSNITTPSQFNEYINNPIASGFFNNTINVYTISSITNISLDGRFYDASNKSTYSPKLTKLTLKMLNGSTVDAYLGLYSDNYNIINYKETVDPNLYQDDCQEAFAYYLNKLLNLTGTAAYTKATALNLLRSCKAESFLPCGNNLGCNNLETYLTDFKAIYKDKQDGKVYKDIKISPVTEKLVQTMSALLKARSTHPNPVIEAPFALEAQGNERILPAYSNKLNSIAHVSLVGGNPTPMYAAIVPLDLNYVYVKPGNKPVQDAFATITALASDFAAAAPANELGKRTIAGNLTTWNKQFGLNVFGVSGVEIPQTDLSYANGDLVPYAALGGHSPLQRYILPLSLYRDHRTGGGTFNHYIYTLPTSITTPTTYNTDYVGFDYTTRAINLADIASIKNVTIDPRFYDAESKDTFSVKLLKLTLTMINGTTREAYLRLGENNGVDREFVKYKETVDPNLYQDDCLAAFTYYVNKRLNLTGANVYTREQVLALIKGCRMSNLLPCNADVTENLLCGKMEWPTYAIAEPDPCKEIPHLAYVATSTIYDIYTETIKGSFRDKYMEKCLNARNIESFTVTSQTSQYHYTLYYYDQAGNLTKTVPPAGVKRDITATWLNQVKTAKANGTILVPQHQMATTYKYNSLNQVVTQHSPDGGFTEFWYDRLGRMVVSRNGKQRLEGTYSFTEYDYLGRITMVGQKKQTTAMTDAISRNDIALKTWIRSLYNTDQIAEQVTRTVYDVEAAEARASLRTLTGALAADYPVVSKFKPKWYTLRNRVANTFYYNKLPRVSTTNNNPDSTQYTTASFYNYDIHGNVDTLVHDYKQGDFRSFNRFKHMAYKYDLISGKVNEVHYQAGQKDQLYHRYNYDAENRITDVYTTNNKYLIGTGDYENRDANYTYYDHGPLARTVIGNLGVQGVDYAYTIQGWLKGVNSTAVTSTTDIGNDGSTLVNKTVAKDEFGFNLNYNATDYKSIRNAQGFNPFPSHIAHMPTTAGTAKHNDLFNGNITSMVVNIPKLDNTTNSGALLYNYKYDQLNRIREMDVFKGFNSTNNGWASMAATQDYKESISYDPNGNILGYTRNGSVHGGALLAMDTLAYRYYYEKFSGVKGVYVPGSIPTDAKQLTNQLAFVKDKVAATNYTVDIDDQLVNNYDYDSIGNLVKDNQEGITRIAWTVYGKIDTIFKSRNNYNDTIVYGYDAGGNRISKSVARSGSNLAGKTKITWYVRDASGNVMAVYDLQKQSRNDNVLVVDYNNLAEHHLYGSSRLGIWQQNINVNASVAAPVNLTGANAMAGIIRGQKAYELTNHLGNVLVTVNDIKTPVYTTTAPITFTHFKANVITASDYYPFGMAMPGRTFTSDKYRYGFNGKEKDNEVSGSGNNLDFGARIYDARLGKWLSVDPLAGKMPGYSSYCYTFNNPINLVDDDGREPTPNPSWKDYIKNVQNLIDAGSSNTKKAKQFDCTKAFAYNLNALYSSDNYACYNENKGGSKQNFLTIMNEMPSSTNSKIADIEVTYKGSPLTTRSHNNLQSDDLDKDLGNIKIKIGEKLNSLTKADDISIFALGPAQSYHCMIAIVSKSPNAILKVDGKEVFGDNANPLYILIDQLNGSKVYNQKEFNDYFKSETAQARKLYRRMTEVNGKSLNDLTGETIRHRPNPLGTSIRQLKTRGIAKKDGGEKILNPRYF